jgi:hypothetical protein
MTANNLSAMRKQKETLNHVIFESEMKLIKKALTEAVDEFDTYSHDHLAEWQAINTNPEKADEAKKCWEKYRKNVRLASLMRAAMAHAKLHDYAKLGDEQPGSGC